MSDPLIICVDDEPNILNAMKRSLRKEPFILKTASSGEEGLRLVQQEDPDIIISDYRMPGMTGIEFLREVKALHPSTITMILSGFADASVILESFNEGQVFRFLTKPWTDDDLKMAIRQCLIHRDLAARHDKTVEQLTARHQELAAINETLGESLARKDRSVSLLQQLLAMTLTPILGLEHDGTVVAANAAAMGMLQKSQHEIVGVPFGTVLPHEVVGAINQVLAEKEESGAYSCTLHGASYCLRVSRFREPGGCVGIVFEPNCAKF